MNNFSFKPTFILALILALISTFSPPPVRAAAACTHYVATGGDDSNTGQSILAPWKTLLKAAGAAQPGNVICVRGGVYNERLTIQTSGTPGNFITFRSYPGERAVLDGSSLAVPANDNGMVYIRSKAYIIIRGFEIRNYRTAVKDIVPIGIRITGTAHHIQLRGNLIHHIEHNGTFVNGTDAHGIAVHGTSGTSAIHNLIIDRNKLYRLKLGSSEALAINGNVQYWQVTNNHLHDVNNIGIVAIGYEDTAPASDRARDGLIAGNLVYNVDSFGNPAYGNERSAGCIYVDGGTRIRIERNRAHHCNLGIELASEHSGRSTSAVTLRNNFVYNNTEVGIAIGGYDTQRGATTGCTIVNNTLFNNNTRKAWGSELYVQYDTRNNVIMNNIIFANSARWYLRSWSKVMSGNVMDYNLFYTGPGTTGHWEWKGVTYSTFNGYKTGSGNDAHSQNGIDPLLMDTAAPDLHLQDSSPAIDSGQNLAAAGTVDIDGEARIQSVIDVGADEVR